jgi:hypothetical protein
MRRYVSALLIAAACCSARADSPPGWPEFSVMSENARFRASIALADDKSDAPKWERKYRIEVQATDRNAPQATGWSAPYRHDGYGGGILSNDGEYFVYVDFWYRHDSAAVKIYRRAAYCSFRGQQLGIEPQGLRQTVSHRVWLSGSPSFVDVAGRAVAVLIPTVQGERRIDLKSGAAAFHGTSCSSPPRGARS